MESEISAGVRSNDIELVQNYLRKTIISQNEMNYLINSIKSENGGGYEMIRSILYVYRYLLTMNLHDFLTKNIIRKISTIF